MPYPSNFAIARAAPNFLFSAFQIANQVIGVFFSPVLPVLLPIAENIAFIYSPPMVMLGIIVNISCRTGSCFKLDFAAFTYV